ncbi:MAG: SAM-dependent methyltransferase [Pseudomonadota bacterium]
MAATLNFIGQIRTPYERLEDCPNNIQPNGPECRIVLKPEYRDGLTGLEPGQTVLLLYWFEGVERSLMLQRSPRCTGSAPTGTFSLRSPHRPNPIAAAVLTIGDMREDGLIVQGIDCLNGTGLLDTKPATRQEIARHINL